MHSGNKTTVSSYYDESVRLGREFQESNKSWAGYDVVKYQKQIKDLVYRYGARTILDYGCGKGLQYQEPLPYGGSAGVDLPQDQWQTFDQYLGVKVYCYDPCVAGFEQLPPEGTKFDGVICTQVLNSIPDDDLPWVRDLLQQYASKFCFVGLNFQREAKTRKTMYDPAYFQQPRTREFFRSYFDNWSGSDLFWWWKDRMHYAGWDHDQLNGVWKHIPDSFEGKYCFVEAIYR
jgi:SAM-dependent methyltransferase